MQENEKTFPEVIDRYITCGIINYEQIYKKYMESQLI